MARRALATPLAAFLLWYVAPTLRADAPEEAGLKNTLALQGAMEQARYFLYQNHDARKAVETLEGQLARVNGNATFLRLLRDAYRAYIKDLYLANQAEQARRYLDRLCVLDPAAANDPTLRPGTAQQKILPTPAPREKDEPKSGGLLPNFAKNFPFLGGEKKAEKTETAAVKPSAVRAQAEDAAVDDPFDRKFERPAARKERTLPALQFVSKADEEFQRRRYVEARSLYEQAYRADQESVKEFRDRWGYCVLSHVVEQLNEPALPPQTLSGLREQVTGAVTMAPSLTKTGQWLLERIDQRTKGSVAAVAVQNRGRNKEGWLVSETANFLIFHKQDDAFGERVAQLAERTRSDMQRKWFGSDAGAWSPKCELIVHPGGQEYSQMTGVSAAMPGHSRIDSDPTNPGRVVGRRLDVRLDAAGVLESVLPHETTHVVLAGQFGPFVVPRWADEGVAVLAEPEEKLLQHRRNLAKAHQEGLLFPLRELMQIDNYPEPRRVGAFYAQSVSLVEFLAAQKGPVVFTQFVRDGLREGYDAALRRHYGWEFGQLEGAWQQQALGQGRVAASATR